MPSNSSLALPAPMLADFAIRLAGGLALFLVPTPWRVVPPRFFRTHCQVILGLWVLAALDLARAGDDRFATAMAIAAAAGAYLAGVAWGLGLPRLGLPLAAGLAGASGLLLARNAGVAGAPVWLGGLQVAARWSSSALLGSTLTAMLLGHYYLIAPAMTIDPLKKLVRWMAWSLGVRGAVAAAGLAIWLGGRGPVAGATVGPLFAAMRWGMGLLGPALATWMAWETVRIRSTQSATGILYIAITLVLFGELTALVLGRGTGLVF